MTDEPMRPDPDRLLEQTAEAHRGKLKIFFGACAGVGKTLRHADGSPAASGAGARYSDRRG